MQSKNDRAILLKVGGHTMKFKIDGTFLIDCFRSIVDIPSPVGYYVQLNPVLEKYAAIFDCGITYDNMLR